MRLDCSLFLPFACNSLCPQTLISFFTLYDGCVFTSSYIIPRSLGYRRLNQIFNPPLRSTRLIRSRFQKPSPRDGSGGSTVVEKSVGRENGVAHPFLPRNLLEIEVACVSKGTRLGGWKKL